MKIAKFAACGLLLSSSIAAAEFSANAALTSDYVYRGVSQTDEKPALQLGLDYNHASGFYGKVWGSNVDFNDDDEARVEVDLIAGYAGSHGKLGYDVGGIYYWYPGADSDLDYDFFEVFGALSYDFGSFALSGGANYSPEFFGNTGRAVYTHLGASVPLGEMFSVSATVGYQDIEDADDYTHWRLGVGATVAGFDLDLSYHDTDLDDGGELADERVVFSVSRSF